MGQSRGVGGLKGYDKVSSVTPDVAQFLQQLLPQIQGNQASAAEGYKQFLPGGGGNQPIVNAANKNFQQQTIPSILNSFGTGSKGSSSLNQALAAGASDLNSNIAALLAQNQLSASQGLGNLGAQQSGAALTPQFGFQQKAQPFWQQALLGAVGAGGQIGGGWLGRTNINQPQNASVT